AVHHPLESRQVAQHQNRIKNACGKGFAAGVFFCQKGGASSSFSSSGAGGVQGSESRKALFASMVSRGTALNFSSSQARAWSIPSWPKGKTSVSTCSVFSRHQGPSQHQARSSSPWRRVL